MSEGLRPWGALVAEARQYVKDATTRIPLGIKQIDDLLRGGIRPGHLALLIGRTEVGKTVATMNMVCNMGQQMVPVYIASLEMGREEVAILLLSSLLGESIAEVERRLVGETATVRELQQALPTILVGDDVKATWENLSQSLEEATALLGSRPAVLVLDHLALMGRYGYPRGEVERISRLTQDAKDFAKSENIAILAVHQVGRAVEGSDTKRNHGATPLTMESMMYGGEMDADYVFGVFRPERDPGLSSEDRDAVKDILVMQVLKNRHGLSSYEGVELHWDRPSMRLSETSGGALAYLEGVHASTVVT